MNIEKKDNYTLITPIQNSFEAFVSTINFSDFETENVILNFVDTFQLSSAQIDSLSEVSQNKKENGTSFIMIVADFDIDDLEDETLSVVPTLGEAEDTLEMDAIERDLGF